MLALWSGVMVMVMLMMLVLMNAMVARTRLYDQRPLQISGDRLIGVRLRGRQDGDALGGEPVLQAIPHATGDQNLDRVQRMRFVRRTLVKRLLDRQLQQGFACDLVLRDVVNPEFATFAGMFGDRAAILAGNGNFHCKLSLAKAGETIERHAARQGQVN